jgi:reverse gyrase
MSSEPEQKALKYKNKYLKLKSNNLNIQSGGEMSLEELARQIDESRDLTELYGDQTMVMKEEINNKLNKLDSKLNLLTSLINKLRIEIGESNEDLSREIRGF